MKNPSDHYIVCTCYSDEHIIRVCKDPDYVDEDEAFYFSFFLNQYRPIWKRLWVAIKYVFGYKCKYGHWDNTIVSNEEAAKLLKYLLIRGNHKE